MGGLELTRKANIEERPQRIARLWGGLESSRKANIEGRPQRIARLWGVESLPGKRIWKDVRSGLLGYGGFRVYLESEY